MPKINWIKVLKIVIGCTSAMFISTSLRLHSSTAVCTITLLSIQNTRRDTITLAIKRLVAFLIALAISVTTFSFMGFTIPAFGTYLLFFTAVCQFFQLTDGLSMSTVLTLHLWVSKNISPGMILNEFILMVIGIVMGFLMNLYMPKQIHEIRTDQRKIETALQHILQDIACKIVHQKTTLPLEQSISQMGGLLAQARKRAEQYRNNTFFNDMSYYVQYVQLRSHQLEIVRRIADNLERLTYVPSQSYMVAEYIRLIASSISEYNNSIELLEELALVKKGFRQRDLPHSREEFEVRAVLFEIVYELKELLELKRDFALSLTPAQVKTFWKKQNIQ